MEVLLLVLRAIFDLHGTPPFGVALLYKLGAALATTSTMTLPIVLFASLVSLALACTSAPNCFRQSDSDACDTALYDEQLVVRYEHRIRVRWISYEVTACTFMSSFTRCFLIISLAGQHLDQLQREFTDIQQRFKGRYVRMYGACDRKASSTSDACFFFRCTH